MSDFIFLVAGLLIVGGALGMNVAGVWLIRRLTNIPLPTAISIDNAQNTGTRLRRVLHAYRHSNLQDDRLSKAAKFFYRSMAVLAAGFLLLAVWTGFVVIGVF